MIQRATLVQGANQATKLDADLLLYKSAPTPVADNAAWAPTYAEVKDTLIGVIRFSGSNAKVINAGSGAAGVVFNTTDGAFNPIPFDCDLTNMNLYGILVAQNAYVPVSEEAFTVKLHVVQL